MSIEAIRSILEPNRRLDSSRTKTRENAREITTYNEIVSEQIKNQRV